MFYRYLASLISILHGFLQLGVVKLGLVPRGGMHCISTPLAEQYLLMKAWYGSQGKSVCTVVYTVTVRTGRGGSESSVDRARC